MAPACMMVTLARARGAAPCSRGGGVSRVGTLKVAHLPPGERLVRVCGE